MIVGLLCKEYCEEGGWEGERGRGMRYCLATYKEWRRLCSSGAGLSQGLLSDTRPNSPPSVGAASRTSDLDIFRNFRSPTAWRFKVMLSEGKNDEHEMYKSCTSRTSQLPSLFWYQQSTREPHSWRKAVKVANHCMIFPWKRSALLQGWSRCMRDLFDNVMRSLRSRRE